MNTHEYTRTVTIIKKEVVYIIKIYQDITIYSYFYSSISCSLSLLSSVSESDDEFGQIKFNQGKPFVSGFRAGGGGFQGGGGTKVDLGNLDLKMRLRCN